MVFIVKSSVLKERSLGMQIVSSRLLHDRSIQEHSIIVFAGPEVAASSFRHMTAQLVQNEQQLDEMLMGTLA
jgi:hypothetical protein